MDPIDKSGVKTKMMQHPFKGLKKL